MDSNLAMILALSAAILAVLIPLVILIVRELRGKKVRHTEAENVVAKWLEGRERTVTELTRLRSEVQSLRTEVQKATKNDGKDTVRIWERIKKIEEGLEWTYDQIDAHTDALKELEPAPAPKNSTNGRYVR